MARRPSTSPSGLDQSTDSSAIADARREPNGDSSGAPPVPRSALGPPSVALHDAARGGYRERPARHRPSAPRWRRRLPSARAGAKGIGGGDQLLETTNLRLGEPTPFDKRRHLRRLRRAVHHGAVDPHENDPLVTGASHAVHRRSWPRCTTTRANRLAPTWPTAARCVGLAPASATMPAGELASVARSKSSGEWISRFIAKPPNSDSIETPTLAAIPVLQASATPDWAAAPPLQAGPASATRRRHVSFKAL